jgi:hypothetical protein
MILRSSSIQRWWYFISSLVRYSRGPTLRPMYALDDTPCLCITYNTTISSCQQPLLPLRQCQVHGWDCVHRPFNGDDTLHQACWGIVEDRHYVPCMPWMILHAFASRTIRQFVPASQPLQPQRQCQVHKSMVEIAFILHSTVIILYIKLG